MGKWVKIFRRSLLVTTVVALFGFLILFAGLMSILGSINQGGNGFNSKLTGVPEEYIPYFNEASELFNMPNWNLAAIAKQESGFRPNCAYGGAYGMMQIQKRDFDGSDIWAYYINLGLGNVYKSLGYSFSSSEEMWQIYLRDPRAQIIAGGYEIRQYTNYVLYKKNKVAKLDYNSNENMKLIDWQADENNEEFREILRRSYAVYNGGPGYGMRVNLDNAQNDYPNSVFRYAMEFRATGLVGRVAGMSDNEIVNAVISEMLTHQGVPYVWGGTTPSGFDCSGLMQYCIRQVTGVQIVRTANEQMRASVPISFNELQPGDFVFRVNSEGYAKHVQMYIGDGKVIHAPQTGDVVKIADVPTDSSRRYGRHPIFMQ